MPNIEEKGVTGSGSGIASGMSRRRFLRLSFGTLAAGAAAAVVLSPASLFASETEGAESPAYPPAPKSGWKIVLQEGYPYPESMRKYAARSVFATREEALSKIKSREYPLSVRKTDS